MPHFDVIYCGSGLSAHLDALQRARDTKNLKFLFIDPQNRHIKRHSWCFWQTRSTIADPCIVKRWDKWSITNESNSHNVSSENTPYCMVWSDLFLSHIADEISHLASCEWRFGDYVSEINGNTAFVGRETIKGAELFDSRLDWSHFSSNTLIQDFCEIHVTSSTPIFNPDTVTLMDFVQSNSAVWFVYLLPLSATEAIVTTTAFSSNPVEHADHNKVFESYMTKRYVVQPDQLSKESTLFARLPMGHLSGPNKKKGIAGGCIRASTGYAFWNHLQKLDKQRSKFPNIDKWLDQLMLKLMKESPREIPFLFMQLFENCPPSDLIAFLQGEGKLSNRLKVISSMNPNPLLMTLLR